MQIIGVVKFVGRHAEVADTFAQAQESWNEGPAEQGVDDTADGAFQIEVMDAEGTQEEGQDCCNQPFFVDFMAQFRRNRRKSPIRIGIEAVGSFLFPLGPGTFQGRWLLSPYSGFRVVQALGRQVLSHDCRFSIDSHQLGFQDLGELFFIGLVELAEQGLEFLLCLDDFIRLESRRRELLIFADHEDGPVLVIIDEVFCQADPFGILLQIIEEITGNMLHIGDSPAQIQVGQSPAFRFHAVEIADSLFKSGLVAAGPLAFATRPLQRKDMRLPFQPIQDVQRQDNADDTDRMIVEEPGTATDEQAEKRKDI